MEGPTGNPDNLLQALWMGKLDGVPGLAGNGWGVPQ
jgi:hypothetical protein